MKQYRDMTPAEQEEMDADLATDGTQPLDVDSRMPDGSWCDWDPELKATVETTADGRKFILTIRGGALVREREIAAPIAV